MAKTKPTTLHPDVFYGAFGGPASGAADADDPGMVMPLESCTYACHTGHLRLTKGVARRVDDACLRNEMRRSGVIA
jgi:hypothetical protein